MNDSCLHCSSICQLALLVVLGCWFLSLFILRLFFLTGMINYYSMSQYPQLPAGAVSIFGLPPSLFYPLATPTTDNYIPKDSPLNQYPSDFAMDQKNPKHWPLIFSWVPANES